MAKINLVNNSILLDKIYRKGKDYQVWMSHSDSVIQLPKGFEEVAKSENSKNSIIQNVDKKIFGLQFHPEVVHTPEGKKILQNFCLKISKCKKDWDMKSFKQEAITKIKKLVGKNKVICGLSGGVDSSVTAVLINEAIGKNLKCVFVDTGMMRKGETETIKKLFKLIDT